MSERGWLFVAALMLLLLLWLGFSTSPGDRRGAEDGVTAIVGAKVFDGEGFVEGVAVVFSGSEILSVALEDEVPASAEIVDARGQTLLPGLIDSHVHSFGTALEDSLLFGVTTVVDMFSDHAQAARWARDQVEGDVTYRADVFSAGTLVTAPAGHGTQFGLDIPTITRADEAEAFVAERIAEGSQFIKIVLEDGSLYGRPIATLDQPTVSAVVGAAHARERLAVAHVSTFAKARIAMTAEVDGLVHLFYDEPVEADWIATAVEAELFVIPTMTVLESANGRSGGASLVSDDRLVSYMSPRAVSGLESSFPPGSDSFATAVDNLRALHAAGLRILAGTDAPNPGTWYGASLHRELELLVEAGLSPGEALRSATSVPADAFGLGDRGRIAPGRLADLVLVDGDPEEDILSTRAIAAIWRRGQPVERRLPGKGASAAAEALTAGPVADFGTRAAWQTSTDQMMGGGSTVTMETAEGGGESGKVLAVQGEIAAGFPFPWAGAMYFPGSTPMAPVDASALTELVFRVKGDGKEHRVMFFAESLGQMPAQTGFVAPSEWTEVIVPLDAIGGLDLSGLKAILFSGPMDLGEFQFTLDRVAVR